MKTATQTKLRRRFNKKSIISVFYGPWGLGDCGSPGSSLGLLSSVVLFSCRNSGLIADPTDRWRNMKCQIEAGWANKRGTIQKDGELISDLINNNAIKYLVFLRYY